MSAPERREVVLDPALVADMRTTLLAEFGARAIYGFLSERTADPELAGVLARCHEDEDTLVEGLTRLMRELGIRRVPSGSRRRTVLAWCVAVASRRQRRSLALRLCLDSEEKLGRSYSSYAEYLLRSGAVDLARRCEELAQIKLQHARILSAWVPR